MEQEYLNDLEIVEIERFCANELQFEAVKKVILQHIYSQGVMAKGKKHNPLKNRALVLVDAEVTNEKLGSKLRALWEGVNALEGGYAELTKIKSKKSEPKNSEENTAI
jgi:hypothetical protein